jgi:hypothetical protein
LTAASSVSPAIRSVTVRVDCGYGVEDVGNAECRPRLHVGSLGIVKQLVKSLELVVRSVGKAVQGYQAGPKKVIYIVTA